jgi:hypothetical protein
LVAVVNRATATASGLVDVLNTPTSRTRGRQPVTANRLSIDRDAVPTTVDREPCA